MKIKVCGITSLQQLKTLGDLGIDYAGMILYEKSKRFPGVLQEEEKMAIKKTPIAKVGVFVNASFETIAQAVDDLGLKAVQLHGDESPELCRELQKLVTVIKVFPIGGSESIQEMVKPFEDVCAYFLFDTQSQDYGGSGQQFDWQILQQAEIGKPFFLSGGIGPDDVDQIKAFHHPYFYGVDLNSRFETRPGLKDINQVKIFQGKISQPTIDKTIKP